MKKLFFATLFALLNAGFMPTAHSATLTWTLQDVVFQDGTAIGSFGYDVDTNTFSAINITTSIAAGGFGVTFGLPSGSGAANLFESVAALADGRPTGIFFALVSAMTNAGGTIAILRQDKSGEYTCSDFDCSTTTIRFVTNGSITASPSAVPIPAALPLFAAGLGALGFTGWRRKRTA